MQFQHGLALLQNAALSGASGEQTFHAPCRAIQYLLKAKAIEQHDCTLLQLGKAYALQAEYKAAIAACLEALQLDSGNAETLTAIGLLYLRVGENHKAFDFLGNALSHDPRSVKAILAAASVIQVSWSVCKASHRSC